MIETCLNIAKSAAEKCKVKTKFNNTLKHYKKDFCNSKKVRNVYGKNINKKYSKDYTELFNNYKCGKYIVDDTEYIKVIETKEGDINTVLICSHPILITARYIKYKREHRNSSNCLYNR